ADGLLVRGDAVLTSRRVQVTIAAARHAVPATYSQRAFTDVGGLMSYPPEVLIVLAVALVEHRAALPPQLVRPLADVAAGTVEWRAPAPAHRTRAGSTMPIPPPGRGLPALRGAVSLGTGSPL